MKITQAIKKLIDKHALAAYPNECCGLIVDGKYIPTPNIAENKEQSFKIDPETYATHLLSGKLQAVIHSHCYDKTVKQKYDPRWASTKDTETWIATDIPWGIVACNCDEVSSILWYDDNEVIPLLDRDFAHGITDCYAIIRDYYRQVLNIKLINHPRGMSWWDNGQDLYNENFARAGFYEITAEEADVNDVCLFQVRSPVINHAAVITGNDRILHHLFFRLSEEDSLGKWRKHIVKYLRHQQFAPAINTDSKEQPTDDFTNSTTPRLISE